MRTSDDLKESVSSFYAELKRIEKLIQAIKDGKRVFFMLDEVLKGTNTHDRHLGASSLIRQLSREDCMGLVSTHDVSLGNLAGKNPSIINWHFSSDLIKEQLQFDYRIKPGICQSFNASQLMSRIGIDLDGNN